MNVYVLTTGGYGHRGIVAVHSSMERALEEKYRRGDPEDNYPEECEFDPKLSPVKEGFELGEVYCVRIYTIDGVIEREYEDTKYRHPEKCEVKRHTLSNFEILIEVLSPISYQHAEEMVVKEKEKFLETINRLKAPSQQQQEEK